MVSQGLGSYGGTKMFVIANTDFAKRLAKAIEGAIHEYGLSTNRKGSLNFAATLWGYRDYKHLLADGVSSSPSAYDEECCAEERDARRSTQTRAAIVFGIKEALVSDFLDKARPTSRRNKKKELEGLPSDAIASAISLAQEAEARREPLVATAILIAALQRSDRRQKVEIVSELKRLCLIEPQACCDLGVAYILGDAGTVDLNEAEKYLDACCEFGRGDRTHAYALTMRGQLEKQRDPDRQHPSDDSLPFYLAAALTGHSPGSAYHCGLYHYQRTNYDQAARFYKMAIRGHHREAMTNLAKMIVDGHHPGDGKTVRLLFGTAAQLGDGAARNAMRWIDDLVRHVDYPELAHHRAMMAQFARHNPFIADDLLQTIPVKEWIEVLSDKGWVLRKVNFTLEYDMDRIADAVDSDENQFPVHITSRSHVTDNIDPLVFAEFSDLHGDGDAILIHNRIHALNETESAEDRYLCIGLIRRDGTWGDLFLEDGGLRVALRQLPALKTNPSLNKGKTFRCNDADSIAD
jgi:hypothetical protein